MKPHDDRVSELERQLQESRKREQAARAEAEEANRLKDEFLVVLSHELRNPLASIVIYSEVLLLKPHAGRIKRAATSIRRNALAQAQIISDLLDLSRLRTGKLALDRQKIHLAAIARAAVESLRAELEDKEILLEFDLQAETVLAAADPIRMQQVVWNLVVNAIKFTPDSGRIRIGLTEEGGLAKLTVEDNGQGIDLEHLPHAFELFRQTDANTTRRHGGMGIGLALVRHLVELHGGNIEAYSAGPGRGTRISVWLPLDGAQPRAQALPASALGVLTNLRVLVVDDTSDIVEALAEMLEMEGATVAFATSGVQALKLTESADFDLVLADIAMSEMDGYQLLEQLRLRGATATVPAIALTGLGRAEDIEQARAAGFVSHLTKPVVFERLIQAVLAATRPSPPERFKPIAATIAGTRKRADTRNKRRPKSSHKP